MAYNTPPNPSTRDRNNNIKKSGPMMGLMMAGPNSGDGMMDDGMKESQEEANYDGPDQGPFMCQNCKFFLPEGACQKVEGAIDPEGCCNLFEKA